VPLLDRLLWRPRVERALLRGAEIADDVRIRRGHRYFIDEFLDHIGAPMGGNSGGGL
jgi:diguanylate cyclase